MEKQLSVRPAFLGSRVRGVLHISRLWAVSLALGSTGCLLLSGRPVQYFGEQCEASNDCPSFGFCAATSSGNVCLPNAAECTTLNDPICGGYACELSYGAGNAYCERYCNSQSDCATGYSCDFANGRDSSCTPDP